LIDFILKIIEPVKRRIKFIPLLIVVMAIAFGIRFGDLLKNFPNLQGDFVPQLSMAIAQDSNEIENETIVDPLIEQDTVGAIPPAEIDSFSNNEWRDSDDTEFEYSQVRVELFRDLSDRRAEIEKKNRELSVREALLKAAEKEINQKYSELISLRAEIKELLKEQTSEEKKRIESLVKIYEGMKPKDAARIFNTLDIDILLDVVSQMSERKSAPIIASMNPDRARNLTMMLIEQKSIPDLSSDFLPQSFDGR